MVAFILGRRLGRTRGQSNLSTRRVVVAGGAGFVGGRIVRCLVAAGHEVHALTRPSSGTGRLTELGVPVAIHPVDAADPQQLARCLFEIRPDVVVNAARAARQRARYDPMQAIRDSVMAAANLVSAAAKADCGLLVQIGSSTEYAPFPGAIAESRPLVPVSLNGATKAAASLVCRSLAQELGLRLTILRPFQVYGPGDHREHLVPSAIAAGMSGRELPLRPEGRRDWVFVDDVAEACRLSLERDPGPVEINLGSGRQRTNLEVVQAVGDALGRPVRVRDDAGMARPWDRADWVADISLAREYLGWEPGHDLQAGLRRTVDWHLEQDLMPGAVGSLGR